MSGNDKNNASVAEINNKNTFFSYEANNVFLVDSKSIDIRENLGPGVYQVLNSPRGFFLQETSMLDDKSKVYGNGQKIVERILKSWEGRKQNTGVLLAGEKGSGKTMTARSLAQQTLSQGKSVIVINSAFSGPSFTQFLSQIKEPIMVLFDEFEKVYRDTEVQEGLLTLLDGMVNSNNLFVFTVNQTGNLADPLLNRPGRILYRIDYSGIPEEVITQYCQENLFDTSLTDSVLRVAGRIATFNFDMLKALVSEMNLHGEKAEAAVRWLNIRAHLYGPESFDFSLVFENHRNDVVIAPIYRGGSDPIGSGDRWNVEAVVIPSDFQKYICRENGVVDSFLLEPDTELPTKLGMKELRRKLGAELQKLDDIDDSESHRDQSAVLLQDLDIYMRESDLSVYNHETGAAVYRCNTHLGVVLISVTPKNPKKVKQSGVSVHWDAF